MLAAQAPSTSAEQAVDAPSPQQAPDKGDIEAGTGDDRVCRVCFEGEDPAQAHANPLISPCLCAGGSRHIHRQCLQRWRQSVQGTARKRAAFRCEVCHFEYQYRRLDGAACIAHPATVMAAFIMTLMLLCYIAGFIPLVRALLALNTMDQLPSALYWLVHFLDGAVILGLACFALLLVTGQLSRSAPCASACASDACASASASCADCGVLAGGGADCGPQLLVLLAGVALLGLLAMVPLAIRVLFDKANELAGAAVVMVENVQHPAAAPKHKATGTAHEPGGRASADQAIREQRDEDEEITRLLS